MIYRLLIPDCQALSPIILYQNVQQIKTIREEDLQIKTGPFTMNEFIVVLKNIKLKKAAGIDEIPPEVLKTGLFNSHLLIFCNEVYNQIVINVWRKGCNFRSQKRISI